MSYSIKQEYILKIAILTMPCMLRTRNHHIDNVVLCTVTNLNCKYHTLFTVKYFPEEKLAIPQSIVKLNIIVWIRNLVTFQGTSQLAMQYFLLISICGQCSA